MTTIIHLSTDEETKQYHLKRLYELSLSHLGDIPQLDEPNDEQKEFCKRKSWRNDKNWLLKIGGLRNDNKR